MLSEAILRVQRAKDHYTHALTQIDRLLHQIVSNDPTQLDDAKAVQASYAVDYIARDLKAAEQPAEASELVDEPSAPTAKSKRHR